MVHFDSEGTNITHRSEMGGLRPPAGFTAEQYPLRHRFTYRTLLDFITAAKNSAMFTLVKNYKTVIDATTTDVNPHHASFVVDGGAVCQPMSIIDKLTMSLSFNMTEASHFTDQLGELKFLWRPIFFSFAEKLTAADEKTTTTVASILSLTSDTTEEDVTPAHATKLPVVAAVTGNYPASTVNLAEVFGLMNLTTNTAPEGVPHDETVFHQALKYYTNKGALKACVGRTRYGRVTKDHPTKTYYIRKFVPKAIRRIMPHTFMAILVHLPLMGDQGQTIHAPVPTATAGNLGVNCTVNYHEWHNSFNQLMVDQS